MNSNEALAAYWGASSNANERTDWDPNLNPITWLHCSGQVGCFHLQASFCRRAGVCTVAILQSLWSYDSHWLKTAFHCGHPHLHSGYHLPYNNAALFHSSLSSSSLVCARASWSWAFSKGKTNWSFSYCLFWFPSDLQRKMRLFQLSRRSGPMQTYLPWHLPRCPACCLEHKRCWINVNWHLYRALRKDKSRSIGDQNIQLEEWTGAPWNYDKDVFVVNGGK